MAERQVIVIGAGIVGVSCASYLQRDGARVTLIDERAPGEGCSFGNAGIIAPGACLPLAMPGIWKKIPKFLLDPLGPLSIRVRYAPSILPWLLRWLQSSSLANVKKISQAMRALHEGAFDAYAPLLTAAGCNDLIQRVGQLYVSGRSGGVFSDPLSRALLRDVGVEVTELGPGELHELEPALSSNQKSGLLFPDHGHALDPFKVVQCLAEEFVRQGGIIKSAKVTGFSHQDGKVVGVKTAGEAIAADQIVVAAGAWSNELTKMLGKHVSLVAERGYHVMLPHPGCAPTRPISSIDYRFAITPMGEGLRFAGMVEIDAASAAPNPKRADVLLRLSRKLLPGIDVSGASRWMGPRSATPDGLPIIDRSPQHPAVFFAFGHSHYGFMGAAVTGRLIAELTAGRPPSIDLRPYASTRFPRWSRQPSANIILA